MALISYTELLPRLYHDEVMKVLESPVGQNATEFSDVLFRTIMADGNNALEALHRNGFIKKVPTNQVLVTPTNTSSVRLDELNDILDEMAKGEEAIKRLADIDANQGITTKKRPVEPREVGAPINSRANPVNTPSTPIMESGVLDDTALATQRMAQAVKMKNEAQQLLAEAARLEKEAAELSPENNAKPTSKKTKKQAA